MACTNKNHSTTNKTYVAKRKPKKTVSKKKYVAKKKGK